MKKQVKKEGLNWGAISITFTVIMMIAVVACFAVVRKARIDDLIHQGNTNIAYFHELSFEDVKVSENRNWFLLPEAGMKFPFSEEIAYRNFGKMPKYQISSYGSEEDGKGKDLEIRLTYHPQDFYDDIWFSTPLAIVRTTVDEGYVIGDEYHDEKREVVHIIDLADGGKIYLVAYDYENDTNDYGEYAYKNLLDALKKLELY